MSNQPRQVKRWDLLIGGDGYASESQSDDGDYVSSEDYDALLEELATLRADVRPLVGILIRQPVSFLDEKERAKLADFIIAHPQFQNAWEERQ